MSSVELQRNMLLGHFNTRLEQRVREEFNIDSKVPMIINWADDGSCIMSIIIGDPEEIFSYLDYNDIKELLEKFFKAGGVEMLEDAYWPDNSLQEAFEEFKKAEKITDPNVTCGAELPDDKLQKWTAVWTQRTVVQLLEED